MSVKHKEMVSAEEVRILLLEQKNDDFYQALKDIKESIQSLRVELKTEIHDLKAELKTEMKEIKSENKSQFRWIMGFILVTFASVVLKSIHF